ncbi:LCP family protein [Pedococcus sp. NPDC057267]|uniref:LCP family protein n=1 Tax=Pedococcus sp. NPDC057267 TaxID=3346077 RepID=UPI00363109DC
MPRPPRLRAVSTTALAVVLVAAVAVVVDAAVLVHRVPTFPGRLPGTDRGSTTLLLASDSRSRLPAGQRSRYADPLQSTGERADLVLLLRREPDGTTRLYSLPRDLYVGAQRHRPHRLGLALEEGPTGVADSLCLDLGVGVDHVLVADMAGAQDLVDATGRVRVRTQLPMRDLGSGLDLPRPGVHELDGEEALAWVRSRHPEVQVGGRWVPDPASDPTRTAHAEQVLSQVAGRIDSPVTLQRVAWSVGPTLRRDEGLDAAGLVRLGRDLRQAVGSPVVTVPGAASGTDVPFTFVTPATMRALAPLQSSSCSAAGTTGHGAPASTPQGG